MTTCPKCGSSSAQDRPNGIMCPLCNNFTPFEELNHDIRKWQFTSGDANNV